MSHTGSQLVLPSLNSKMSMDQTITAVTEEEENLYSCTYEGPQDCNDKPVRQDGEQEQGR